jgi:hypothetical protein
VPQLQKGQKKRETNLAGVSFDGARRRRQRRDRPPTHVCKREGAVIHCMGEGGRASKRARKKDKPEKKRMRENCEKIEPEAAGEATLFIASDRGEQGRGGNEGGAEGPIRHKRARQLAHRRHRCLPDRISHARPARPHPHSHAAATACTHAAAAAAPSTLILHPAARICTSLLPSARHTPAHVPGTRAVPAARGSDIRRGRDGDLLGGARPRDGGDKLQ